MATAVKVVLTGTMISSLMFAGPLNLILGALKHLQVSTTVLLLAVNLPGNVGVFIQCLMDIVHFSLIDTDDFFKGIFKLDEVEPFNDNFANYGYPSLYCVLNLGTLVIIMTIVPIIYTVSITIWACALGHRDYTIPWQKKFDDFIFFNGTITFIDESYILFALSAALNVYYFRWDTVGNVFNCFCSMALWFVVVAAPIFTFKFYHSEESIMKREYRDKVFMSKYGDIVEPLAINRDGNFGDAIYYITAT